MGPWPTTRAHDAPSDLIIDLKAKSSIHHVFHSKLNVVNASSAFLPGIDLIHLLSGKFFPCYVNCRVRFACECVLEIFQPNFYQSIWSEIDGVELRPFSKNGVKIKQKPELHHFYLLCRSCWITSRTTSCVKLWIRCTGFWCFEDYCTTCQV